MSDRHRVRGPGSCRQGPTWASGYGVVLTRNEEAGERGYGEFDVLFLLQKEE